MSRAGWEKRSAQVETFSVELFSGGAALAGGPYRITLERCECAHSTLFTGRTLVRDRTSDVRGIVPAETAQR